MPSPSPPWSPTREPQGRYEELAPMDEYGLMAPGASTGDLSDRASVDDDAVHHDDHGGSGWAQTPAWNICLNAAMYCAVPLSMPATLAAGGWFWGTVFFTYCTCATYWTGLIIGRVYLEHRGRLATYPAMAAEAFSSLAFEHTGDTRIANDVRVHARRCVEAIQFATFYLDTVTQIVYVAQYFGQLDRGWVTGENRTSCPDVPVGVGAGGVGGVHARHADTILPRVAVGHRPGHRGTRTLSPVLPMGNRSGSPPVGVPTRAFVRRSHRAIR